MDAVYLLTQNQNIGAVEELVADLESDDGSEVRILPGALP